MRARLFLSCFYVFNVIKMTREASGDKHWCKSRLGREEKIWRVEIIICDVCMQYAVKKTALDFSTESPSLYP